MNFIINRSQKSQKSKLFINNDMQLSTYEIFILYIHFYYALKPNSFSCQIIHFFSSMKIFIQSKADNFVYIKNDQTSR